MAFYKPNLMKREAIVKAASQMKNTKDLLVLLNRIKMDELGEKGHPFTMPQLNYFLNPKRNINSYRTFTIPKKSGGVRTISAPVRLLKSFQTYLNRILQAFYEAPDCVTGFVQGKSVVDNAERHLGQNYVFNTDLKDFFPSITQARVWGALKTRPFNFPEAIASAIAGICCIREEVNPEESGRTSDSFDVPKTEYRYVLPQGSPCSPVLTNIVCHNLDWKLSGLARRFQVRYSRYADDITFSSPHNVYQEGGEFMTELRKIIAGQNLTVNEKKTRLQKRGARQEVTGLVVSDRANVTREYVRDLDNLLYIWEKYGHNAAFAKFLTHYTPKQNLMDSKPNMASVIEGRLNYIRMVKGEDSPIWRRLQKRFNRLVDRKESSGGTDIVYLHSYPIADFEKSVGTTIEFEFNGEDPTTYLYPRFCINGQYYRAILSRYARTRLNNILESGDEAALQKFRETFHIAYCTENGEFYWMIKRKPAKKKVRIIETVDIDTLLKETALELPPEEQASDDHPGLSTEETLEALVSSDFDLNTLDQWEQIRKSR